MSSARAASWSSRIGLAKARGIKIGDLVLGLLVDAVDGDADHSARLSGVTFADASPLTKSLQRCMTMRRCSRFLVRK